jgi:PAS domain S-box-containing protein
MENTQLREQFLASLNPFGQLSGLFDLLPGLSFFMKDQEGRFMALNRQGCEYCGVSSEEEAIGCTDHDFFPAQRADQYRADDLSVLNSGEPIVNRIESAPEPAGSPRLVMTSKVPLFNNQGDVVGIAGFSRQVENLREHTGKVNAFADVIEHLHKNYSESLTTEDLAMMADLSVPQFERRFRSAFGTSPHQYLMRVRIENATQMLIDTDLTITDIAQACGFYDHAHFSRLYRRFMNTSPTKYRSKHRPSNRLD